MRYTTAILLAIALAATGCSRVTVAYNTADFFAKQYATEYLNLSSEQISRWEPRLERELAKHRSDELPTLARFFDTALQGARSGFDSETALCLTGQFRRIYQRHARLAVELAAPLLAGLTSSQMRDLEKRFRDDALEDEADLAKRSLPWEKQKRARRYAESVERWTGPLTESQKRLIADVTGRMPDSEAAVAAYRARKRQELVGLLRRHPREAQISAFMTDWLVDFRDLPSELKRDGDAIEARMVELLTRLSPTLDASQRNRLEKRLRQLRDDLMRLQKTPRMAPPQC